MIISGGGIGGVPAYLALPGQGAARIVTGPAGAFASALLTIPGIDEAREGQKADRQADYQGRENGCHINCSPRRLFAVPRFNGMIINLRAESSVYAPI